ncbi:TIGR02678 family protein [Saccharopolyspora gloriosae]|uniref:TIGR02678 family protein n=1 Tax=Saccharopolyspora gloriosae TaxID=455344 RepID=UPI001FB7EFCF|nr:TIGR02678 family protein [Saccharopolyspora gloriosae]
MSNLANQLVIAERTDLARGIRLLLARPLISAEVDPDAFDLVRRRKDTLTGWFDYHCGWALTVEPRLGYARLAKVRSDPDSSRPARRNRTSKAPFDRRRYTLFCVAAAELLGGPATTVGLLADRIVQATAADPVLTAFDTAMRSERMAFVDVLRALESFGVLESVDGSTESFVDSAEAKVLYRVDATLLMRLLSAPNGASQLPEQEAGGDVAALLAESRYGNAEQGVSEVQRNLWLRHSVLRKLFDDPVVYWADLTEAQHAYVTSPTGRQIMRKAAEQGGFVLEERAEGVLLVDPEALATDAKFPDDANNAKVAALHLLDALGTSPRGRTAEQLRADAESVLDRSPGAARTYRYADGPARLVTDAVAVLVDFGLARRDGERIVALPAAARYSVVSGFPDSAGGNPS